MPGCAPFPNGVTVDLAGERLRARDGTTIPLRPQAFATLRYLLAHPMRLVSKDELFAAVWGGEAVSDDSLVQCIHEIRRALGDHAHAVLQTAPRRGYRLAAAGTGEAGSAAPIAVLPFENLGDARLATLAKGLTDEVIAGLAPFRSLAVIPRTEFARGSDESDPRAVAARFAARYLLGGSLRREGARFRVIARLVDGETGRLVWSGRFEAEAADLFELQDRLTAEIVGVVAPTLRRAEIERARRARPASLDAYELVLRALPHVFANSAEGCEAALPLVEAALARDPDYLAAHACAAWSREQRYLRRGLEPDDRAAALAHAARATDANADDAEAMSLAAFVQGTLTRDYDRSAALVERAVALNANSATVHGFGALVAAHGGRDGDARAHADRALRLGPAGDPLTYHPHCALAVASLFAGRLEEAADCAARAIRANPAFSPPYVYLATARAHLGDVEAARRAAARLIEAAPGFSAREFARAHIFGPERMAALVDGLRQAGAPGRDARG